MVRRGSGGAAVLVCGRIKKRYNMGCETLLTPVEWPEGEFPSITPVEID